MRRTAWIALALSCVAHLLLLSWSEPPHSTQQHKAAPGEPLSLELILLEPTPVEQAGIPDAVKTPLRTEPALPAELALPTEPPQPRQEIKTAQRDLPTEFEEKEDAALPHAGAKPPSLNLSRPSNWDTLAIAPPGADPAPFQRSFSEAVESRRGQQRRSAVLNRAQLARLGLPEQEFRQRNDSGEQVKTAKGCFEKRTQMTPTGLEERWWRISCRGDGKKKAWQREVLTFGPDHRVIDATDAP